MITRILLKFKVFSLRLKIWRFKIGRSGFSILRSRATAEDGRTNHVGLFINKKGFTLIEIIILIVMAGILLPAIIIPFVTGVKRSGKPEMVTRAMYLGQQRTEELMKFNYTNAALTPTAGLVSFSTGDPNYPGEYEIVYVSSGLGTPSADVGYKRIIVRVRDPENTAYELYAVVTNFP